MRTASLFAVAVVTFTTAAFASEETSEVTEKVSAETHEPTERMNRVSIGAAGLIYGVLGVEYERAFSKQFSAAAGGVAFFPSAPVAMGLVNIGAGGTLELRYHPFADKALTGFWVGPQSNTNIQIRSNDYTSEVQIQTNMIAMLGYTWVGDSGLSVSGGGGLGLGLTLSSNYGLAPSLGFSGHLNVGYAF